MRVIFNTKTMAEEKKIGDNGFDITVETQAARDFAAYHAYNDYIKMCNFTSEEALQLIGYSQEEFEKVKMQFEPTDQMIEQ